MSQDASAEPSCVGAGGGGGGDSLDEVFTIYHEGVALQLRWLTLPPLERQPVVRMCAVDPALILLLTGDHNMYTGRLDGNTLRLKHERSNVTDCDYCADTRQLFVVLATGNVLMQPIHNGRLTQVWEELQFDPLELSEDGVMVQRVCCSEQGVLFVSSTGDTYVMGNCGEVFAAQAQPKPMRFFDEKCKQVLDVAAGADYFVLLLKRNKLKSEEAIPNTTTTTTKRPPTHKVVETNGMAASGVCLSEADHHEFNSNSSLRSRSSSSTSSRLHAETRLETVLHRLLDEGYSLLTTQVYTFGSRNNGLLGTGDHVKRHTTHNVQKLEAVGVCSIATGKAHTVVRTLEGRLYHWGLERRRSNASEGDTLDDLSAPTELKFDRKTELSDQQRCILAACCGDYQTVLMDARGKVHTECDLRHKGVDGESETDLISLQMGTHARKIQPLLLASGRFTLSNRRQFQRAYYDCFHGLRTHMQTMIDQRITVQRLAALDPTKFTSGILWQIHPICTAYQSMLYLQAALLHSLEKFYRGDITDPLELYFVRYHRECIALFAEYTHIYCDTYSANIFQEVGKLYGTITSSMCADFESLFRHPLMAVQQYEHFLLVLLKGRHEFNEHLIAWQTVTIDYLKSLALAKQTQDFWQRHARHTRLRHLRAKQRRVVLSSSNLKMNIISGGGTLGKGSLTSTSPLFVLFSDFLCEVGSQLQTYPLDVLWLQRDAKTPALRLITPERSFRLTTRHTDELKLWHDTLEASIAAALGRPAGERSPNARMAGFHFSKSHAKYPNVEAYGRWVEGVLHGSCCQLEYPDGKLYCGSMRHGEIEGHGKMVLPSVGMYEGGFKGGKFHGQGCYEMRDNAVYEGNFRDGLMHGHGCWRSNDFTYVGEYQANARCGYGVLDDTVSGDKYMGMFADNKRTGAGTCITMKGDYFEGVFVNDALSSAGCSVAVFENGFYYEGELSMMGPAGKGSYYMPLSVSGGGELEQLGLDDDDKSTVSGSVLSGQLTGTWDDVRIANGSIAMQQRFSRFSKIIGDLVVDNNRKWRSLFADFEDQLCDMVAPISKQPKHDLTKHLWNCIAVHMTAERERERRFEQQQQQQLSPRDANQLGARTSYFGKNISMGFNGSTLSNDKLNIKSPASAAAAAKSSIFDMSSMSWNGDTTDADTNSLRLSHSQETLNVSNFISDVDAMTLHSATATHYGSHHNALSTDENHSFNSHLQQWANDSTSSIRSTSCDSVLNYSETNNNNSSLLQNGLDYVPNFGLTPGTLTSVDVASIKEYLIQAFKDPHHPLFILNKRVANCFYTSYGCWKVKPTPILAKQAMLEWESIAKRVYAFVRKMFPALPEDYCVLESSREVVSHITLLYPIVLSEGIYSTLFVLYANKYSRKDEFYRQSLMHAEKQDDYDLILQLGLDKSQLTIVQSPHFYDAIQTLKQLQEKYSPKAMLTIIENCFHQITEAHRYAELCTVTTLAADNMMPLTLFLVLRAAVPHLGAELALLDDLTGGANFEYEMNGMTGYCYTTLKAAYEHITVKPLGNNAYA